MFDSFKNSLENFTKGSFVSSSQNDKQAIGIAGYTLVIIKTKKDYKWQFQN